MHTHLSLEEERRRYDAAKEVLNAIHAQCHDFYTKDDKLLILVKVVILGAKLAEALGPEIIDAATEPVDEAAPPERPPGTIIPVIFR